MARADGREVIHLPAVAASGSAPAFASIVERLRAIDPGAFPAAYLLDDRDDLNLQCLVALLSVHPTLPVVLSLSNESIAPHLQAANPNVRVVNPFKMAAPALVDTLDTPLSHTFAYERPPAPISSRRKIDDDPLVRRLSAGFGVVIVAATGYFRYAEDLSWVDALYFVIVTIATVGYGDISLRNSSTLSKLIGIALIVSATCFIWMIFSLTIDRVIKRRVQLALGRRTYTHAGHVIVCGLGRLGYFVAERLIARGERVLVIELNAEGAKVESLRALGADVYIGDARVPGVLQEVGITRAKALYSIVNNDLANLEIGLIARTIAPDLRLVLRIFDDGMAARLREQLDIQLTVSMTAIVDEQVYRALPSVAATAP